MTALFKYNPSTKAVEYSVSPGGHLSAEEAAAIAQIEAAATLQGLEQLLTYIDSDLSNIEAKLSELEEKTKK